MTPSNVPTSGDTGVLSFISVALSWLVNDAPLFLFGAQLSVMIAGFAGAMAIVSFLPKFETAKAMWTTVMVCTIAAAYLTKLALHASGLDASFSLGMAFVVGFAFQFVGTGLVQYAPKIWEAITDRIRGTK